MSSNRTLEQYLLNYNTARRANTSGNRAGHRSRYMNLLNAINRELRNGGGSTLTRTNAGINATAAANAVASRGATRVIGTHTNSNNKKFMNNPGEIAKAFSNGKINYNKAKSLLNNYEKTLGFFKSREFSKQAYIKNLNAIRNAKNATKQVNAGNLNAAARAANATAAALAAKTIRSVDTQTNNTAANAAVSAQLAVANGAAEQAMNAARNGNLQRAQNAARIAQEAAKGANNISNSYENTSVGGKSIFNNTARNATTSAAAANAAVAKVAAIKAVTASQNGNTAAASNAARIATEAANQAAALANASARANLERARNNAKSRVPNNRNNLKKRLNNANSVNAIKNILNNLN